MLNSPQELLASLCMVIGAGQCDWMTPRGCSVPFALQGPQAGLGHLASRPSTGQLVGGPTGFLLVFTGNCVFSLCWFLSEHVLTFSPSDILLLSPIRPRPPEHLHTRTHSHTHPNTHTHGQIHNAYSHSQYKPHSLTHNLTHPRSQAHMYSHTVSHSHFRGWSTAKRACRRQGQESAQEKEDGRCDRSLSPSARILCSSTVTIIIFAITIISIINSNIGFTITIATDTGLRTTAPRARHRAESFP